MSERTSIVVQKSTHREVRENKPDGWNWDAYLRDMLETYKEQQEDD